MTSSDPDVSCLDCQFGFKPRFYSLDPDCLFVCFLFVLNLTAVIRSFHDYIITSSYRRWWLWFKLTSSDKVFIWNKRLCSFGCFTVRNNFNGSNLNVMFHFVHLLLNKARFTSKSNLKHKPAEIWARIQRPSCVSGSVQVQIITTHFSLLFLETFLCVFQELLLRVALTRCRRRHLLLSSSSSSPSWWPPDVLANDLRTRSHHSDH